MVVREPTPDGLVDATGRVRFGVFDGPLRRIGLEHARLTLAGRQMPLLWSRLRLKRWQHIGLVLPDLFCGLAVVDAGHIRTSWCHVVDRIDGGHFEHRRLGPLLDVAVADTLWDDACHARSKGYAIEIANRLEHGEHRISVEIAADKGRAAVRAQLTCRHDLARIQPLVVSLPVGDNRALYSHKVALPVEGTVQVGDKRFTADPDQAFAIWDVHQAHYPRHTFWRWATCAGRDAQGRALALNLTRNVNVDDARYNENALWIDGRIHHLGPATFELNPDRPLLPWRVATLDGAVELRFEPQGERFDDTRLGVVQSVFHQPYGTFHGQVRLGEAQIPIDGLFGVCEDHRAVW